MYSDLFIISQIYVRGETARVSKGKKERKTEQCALIKLIKASTELCLDVFIQLMSKVADDCLTFITN